MLSRQKIKAIVGTNCKMPSPKIINAVIIDVDNVIKNAQIIEGILITRSMYRHFFI